MSVLMTFRIAVKALGRNKMRTALTMLGMIIGVAAVITLVAMGNGAQAAIEDQIKSAGTNMITVFPGSVNMGGVRQGGGPLYVWIGFIAGLTVSAVLLVSRYLYVSRRSPAASAVEAGVV